jgi:hypothetical protein
MRSPESSWKVCGVRPGLLNSAAMETSIRAWIANSSRDSPMETGLFNLENPDAKVAGIALYWICSKALVVFYQEGADSSAAIE